MRTHLFTDADNTLWDTNAVFIAAQLAMLSDLESITGRQTPASEDRGLTFLRGVDQRIAAVHPEHLRYPPVLLARGLTLALEGANADQAAMQALHCGGIVDLQTQRVVERFVDHLRRVPSLRDSVIKGLEAAAMAAVPVTVVSEERLERCHHLIAAHGLGHLIGEVLSIRKTVDAFHDLKTLSGVARPLMVGDQIDRDIKPPRQAGFETFLFASAFVPYWNADAHSIAHHRISRYDELTPFFIDREHRFPFGDGGRAAVSSRGDT